MGKFLGVFLLLISVVMIGQIFLAGALILSKIISSEGAADVYFLNIDPFPGYISGWWVWLFIVVYLLVGGLLFKVGVKLCGKVNNSPSPEAEPGEGYIYKPVIENINDDWFVTDGCCTLCNIPFMIAEDLFEIKSVDGNEEYCYISKQPKENEDLQKMVKILHNQELDCIRYRGGNQAVLNILTGEGCIEYTKDNLPSPGAEQ